MRFKVRCVWQGWRATCALFLLHCCFSHVEIRAETVSGQSYAGGWSKLCFYRPQSGNEEAATKTQAKGACYTFTPLRIPSSSISLGFIGVLQTEDPEKSF